MAADDSAAQARGWLERMSQALSVRNYDVRFLHLVGSHAENMRIIHRVADDGKVTERLVALDGSGRELVRSENELVCYMPDRHKVLVEKRVDHGSFFSTVPNYSEELLAYYSLAAPTTTRLLGRSVQYVTVQPRDHLRYGYKLWIDRKTALPLKSQLCDRDGRVVEQIVFTDVQTPAHIDAKLVRTSISTKGYTWVRQEAPVGRPTSLPRWVVANPPQGFRVTITRVQRIVGAAGLVRHIVLSDGLASVSVFIEPRQAPSDQASGPSGSKDAGAKRAEHIPELARVGSALAYSTEADHYRVTVVGEVPMVTLKAIAESVRRQAAADGNNATTE